MKHAGHYMKERGEAGELPGEIAARLLEHVLYRRQQPLPPTEAQAEAMADDFSRTVAEVVENIIAETRRRMEAEAVGRMVRALENYRDGL